MNDIPAYGIKLSLIKVCVECDEIVHTARNECPSCNCTTFFFPRKADATLFSGSIMHDLILKNVRNDAIEISKKIDQGRVLPWHDFPEQTPEADVADFINDVCTKVIKPPSNIELSKWQLSLFEDLDK